VHCIYQWLRHLSVPAVNLITLLLRGHCASLLINRYFAHRVWLKRIHHLRLAVCFPYSYVMLSPYRAWHARCTWRKRVHCLANGNIQHSPHRPLHTRVTSRIAAAAFCVVFTATMIPLPVRRGFSWWPHHLVNSAYVIASLMQQLFWYRTNTKLSDVSCGWTWLRWTVCRSSDC